jgi:hypothetical protein
MLLGVYATFPALYRCCKSLPTGVNDDDDDGGGRIDAATCVPDYTVSYRPRRNPHINFLENLKSPSSN